VGLPTELLDRRRQRVRLARGDDDSGSLGDEGLGFIAMMQRLPLERIGAAVANTARAVQILRETFE
jgi:hypothetical protein